MSTLISFDYAIKYLLKDKGDYEIVEGFISAILQAEGYGAVKIKALLEPESNKEEKDLKHSVADLLVEDEKGVAYIVEIERLWTESFLHKACFNSSRLIVDNIYSGGDYRNIKKVFHISLLYFRWHNSEKALHHGKTIFKEVDSGHPIDLHIRMQDGKTIDLDHIFPEYFLISVPLFDDIIHDELDEWLYVVKNSRVKDDFKSPYMKKVAERLNILTMTSQEKYTYEKFMRETFKERDAIEAAEHKGKTEGKIEGKIEIAKKLINKGMPLKDIAEIIELSIEELNNLPLQ
jgi:predicted transposase/invertase (TIGR01784 family)